MIIKSLKYAAILFLGAPIYLISKIFPKNRNLCIIGSNLGKHFADNPKYYYIQHYRSLKAREERKLVWISKNKKVTKQLKSLDLPAEYLYTWKGVYTTLRANRAFISHQLKDINGPLMGGAKIVQLWHAMALRKVGYGGDWYDDNFRGKIRSHISKWLPYAYYMKCDVLLAPCQEAKDNSIEPFSKSFRNGKISENIFLARQPRTFCFENEFVLSKEFFPERELLLSFTNKYDKIIAWLPTQRRQFGKTIVDVISDSKLDFDQLNGFCRTNNYLFVIKAHFLDFEETSKIVRDLDFIFVYPYTDPYPLLKYSDILITDYSSVFFDFLLLNRPILFMCYDLEIYKSKAKFYYDYENLEIGPICKSWDKIFEAIINIKDYNDEYIDKRSKALHSFDFVTESKIEIPDEI